tara:strand:- start:38 stop:1288 length:1251 start_codon:yes stop_codon:yes gene_type:complete
MPKSSPSKDFHKQIRTLLDTGNYTEIIKTVKNHIESKKPFFPDTISNILANVPKFVTELSDIEYLLSLIKEEFNELTYTSLINIFTNIKFFSIKKVYYYYEKMKVMGIPVKRRTISPIFKEIKEKDTIIYFYIDSKVQNIELTIEDYINILHIKLPIYFSDMITYDMSNVIDSSIDIKYKSIFDKIFKCESIDYSPNKYCVNRKESGKMVEKMKIYIGHFYGKNQSILSNISKSMKEIKKIKYSIVIDGANIGFYKRGTMSGKKICFKRLYKMAIHLSSMKYKPIIILHKSHMDNATHEEEIIIRENKEINLFIVPRGVDDDWFWLYAALSNTSSMLVTNDEMRNHFHYINFDKEFINWKNTKVINYDMDERNLEFTLKEPYPFLKKININMVHRHLGIPFQNGKEIIWKKYSFID